MLKAFLRNLSLTSFLSVLLIWGCTKLDTTNIGSGLIPAVDNINTFADTLAVSTTQGFFDDSTATSILFDNVLGSISNDPIFGTSKANIYLQPKPVAFPFRYGNVGDTLSGFGAGLDSVVLCLSYKTYFGDNTVPQNLVVRQIYDQKFSDSSQFTRNIKYRPNVLPTIVGSKIFDIRSLKDSVKIGGGKDSVVNQIRIKLNLTYAAGYYGVDTAAFNPFTSDTLWRKIFHGLAVEANGGGNALMYIALNDPKTRLEVHYRRRNKGLDTTFTYLPLVVAQNGGVVKTSATANYIERNRTGFPVSLPSPNQVYVQAAPGTFVNLSIPGIATLSNRIIHRAELIMEQVPNNNFFDTTFRAPDYLYVDCRDSSLNERWKPVYFDLSANSFVGYNPDSKACNVLPNEIDYIYYGGYRRIKFDYLGNPHAYYNINLSRHIQQIVTRRTPNYNFRLYAPYVLSYPQACGFDYKYSNALAFGRVALGSGLNPNYRMRLRVIYSKL